MLTQIPDQPLKTLLLTQIRKIRLCKQLQFMRLIRSETSDKNYSFGGKLFQALQFPKQIWKESSALKRIHALFLSSDGILTYTVWYLKRLECWLNLDIKTYSAHRAHWMSSIIWCQTVVSRFTDHAYWSLLLVFRRHRCSSPEKRTCHSTRTCCVCIKKHP